MGEVTPDTFCVWLIPETLRATTFGERAVGDVVNIELDSQTVAIVDTVERVLTELDTERGRRVASGASLRLRIAR